jgi:hypothetical protein
MNEFQFDECFDDRVIRIRCNSERLCVAKKYPRELRGTKDPQMLPELLRKDAALVTTDGRIVDDNIDHIPYPHPGIIAIGTRDASKTLTTRIAAKNLDQFKGLFVTWHLTDWSGTFLEIDEDKASLHLVGYGALVNIGSVATKDTEFPARFSELLTEAEVRKTVFGPQSAESQLPQDDTKPATPPVSDQ